MDGNLQDLTEFLHLLSVSSIYRWRFESTRKKYLHKYSTEMSKNHTFPITIRSFVCFLLNFCCIFLWSYFFSVHSNQHPHTARFTSFVSLVKISKKLHWPNLLSIPGEEPIFCFFFSDSPVYHLFPSRWDLPQNMS